MQAAVARFTEHVVAAIASAKMQTSPFEHFVVDDALPPELFARLRDDLPTNAEMVSFADQDWVPMIEYDRRAVTVCADLARGSKRSHWREVFDVLTSDDVEAAIVEKYRPVAHDAALRRMRDPLRREVELQLDHAGSYLRPHTDAPSIFVTAMIHMSAPFPDECLNTILYEPLDARGRLARIGGDFTSDNYAHEEAADHREVSRVEFRPNRMMSFLRSPHSVHGLGPLAEKAGPRYVVTLHHKFSTRSESLCNSTTMETIR